MPIPKGPNCFGDVMGEYKRGELHSGKGGPKVKSRKQAKAIAASMCYDEGCGGACGCEKCPRAQARVMKFVELGYAEDAAHEFVFGQMAAPLGYPTPQFGPEIEQLIDHASGKPNLWDNIRKRRKAGKRPKRPGEEGYPKTLDVSEPVPPNIKYGTYSEALALFGELDGAMSDLAGTFSFGEDGDTAMAKARIDVMRGRLEELMMKIMEMDVMGDVKIDGWMRDKLTMAADYISAVADNAVHGGGIEVEIEPTINVYEESGYDKGLTKEEIKSRKRTAKKRMASTDEPAEKAFAPFPSDRAYNKRNEGKKMPKSKHTKAYEKMYGKSDHAEVEFEEKGKSKKKGLAKKAEDSGIPIGILKSVYAKGMAAWKSGHRPGTTPQQWAMARVNSFITGSGGARKADADLWKRASAAKKNKK